MTWNKDYKQKTVTLEAAISHIKSGNIVSTGHATTESVPLVDEMVRQKDRLTHIKTFHQNPFRRCEHLQDGLEDHFHGTFMFANPIAGNALTSGKADFIPINLSDLPNLFLDGIIKPDVALIQLSPPDQDGYFSFGVGCAHNNGILKSSKLVIAEINAQMPRTKGTRIHISEIDCLVETSRPILELPRPKIDTVAEKIGTYIASLVEDGANLQLGFGSVPDAVLSHLKDKKDLGIHTEMFSDGILELYEAGIITNKYNNLNPGKIITTYVAGTQKLYDWVVDNPDIEVRPVEYTNSILNAGRINQLISINSALQIDLSGQVNAEMIGDLQFSGVGGQSDFVRAALLSPGGKSIIALPSTAKRGTVSRIVPRLDEGACVTTTRHDVQYVATEYGIVNLRGMCLRERAQALIEIAHPDFRDELTASLKSTYQK